eukprot:scaffold7109_cov152-Skeletonema_marinoi.AAC.2
MDGRGGIPSQLAKVPARMISLIFESQLKNGDSDDNQPKELISNVIIRTIEQHAVHGKDRKIRS